MRIKVSILLIFFPLTLCFSKQEKWEDVESNDKSNSTIKFDVNKDSLENEVYKAVLELQEIKSYSHKLDSISKGKYNMTAIIRSSPTEEEPFFWVQVGVNNGVRLVPEYNFYVYLKDKLEVKYFDTINDEIISLTDWRKKKNH